MRVFGSAMRCWWTFDAVVSGDSVRGKWEMFIFSEDVRTQDWSTPMAQIGVYGPRAAEFLYESPGTKTGRLRPSPVRLDSMPVHANVRATFENNPLILLRGDDAGVRGFDRSFPLRQPVCCRRGSWQLAQ